MAQRKRPCVAPLHPMIRKALLAEPHETDAQLLAFVRRRARTYCKPCWELKYCPYGSMVEDFPHPPTSRAQADANAARARAVLESGKDPDGNALDPQDREHLEWTIRYYSGDFPEAVPKALMEMRCTQFGHICPVFFHAEEFTETTSPRRTGRYVAFSVKMRVARRDNFTCQHCGVHLTDEQMEFDHVIPLSRGGSSEEHNIRLTCFDCNRDKGARVEL